VAVLVDASGLGAHRPGRALFEDLSLTVRSGDRIGIVGINGTGKSTLLRVIAGLEPPEVGVVRRGRGVRIGLLGQAPVLAAGTVSAVVGAGAAGAVDSAVSDWEAAALLERVGMGAFADTDTAVLSGGQAKRVALASVLARPADLLILDEPTNHLDIDAIAWLEGWLDEYRGGLVLVTHDRHVLDRVTTRMIELDGGSAFTHDGGYSSYLEARALRQTQAATAETTRRNLARAELAWLRRGAPARSRKPKARMETAKATVTGAEVAAPAARGEGLELAAASPIRTPRLGDKVIELHDVGHRFGSDEWLWEHLDLDLDPRGRLAILGANGTGKTTLLDLLAGRFDPAAGTISRGPTVVVGYYDQKGKLLDPAQRVRDAVAGPTRQPGWEDAALMERFWFDADAQWAPIGTLSGGERRRLQLLLVLAAAPNVLLLDEPTNDLDLDTLRVLEDYLETWPGSLVVVSHDRAFLERTVEDVLALDRGAPGSPGLVPGGYVAWEEWRRRRRPGRSAAAAAGSVALPSPALSSPALPSPALSAIPAAGPASPAASPAVAAGGRKVRSPSTLRRLIGLAERDMETYGAARAALIDRLGEVAADHVALAKVGVELATVESQLAEAEARWLALAEELG